MRIPIGYCIGLEAFWDRSVNQANKARNSTPKWRNAVSLAQRALVTAIKSREIYEEKGGEASEATAVEAVKLLSQRYSISSCSQMSFYRLYDLLISILPISVEEAPTPVRKKPYIRAHVTRELLACA